MHPSRRCSTDRPLKLLKVQYHRKIPAIETGDNHLQGEKTYNGPPLK
jgi:hypothetical protein